MQKANGWKERQRAKRFESLEDLRRFFDECDARQGAGGRTGLGGASARDKRFALARLAISMLLAEA